MQDDILDGPLDLEEGFHHEGYQLGVADGRQAGRLEGHVFGLEKGFEKWLEMGRLHGRTAIWASRLPGASTSLPLLPENARLEKHVQAMKALTDPTTLSRENSETGVDEFEDRVKRALARMKLADRIVGETNLDDRPADANGAPVRRYRVKDETGEGNIEDLSNLSVRR